MFLMCLKSNQTTTSWTVSYNQQSIFCCTAVGFVFIICTTATIQNGTSSSCFFGRQHCKAYCIVFTQTQCLSWGLKCMTIKCIYCDKQENTKQKHLYIHKGKLTTTVIQNKISSGGQKTATEKRHLHPEASKALGASRQEEQSVCVCRYECFSVLGSGAAGVYEGG